MSLNKYQIKFIFTDFFCLFLSVHWFQVLNQVLDMTLTFNNQKPVSLFANSCSLNLISENKYVPNQCRYNDQSDHPRQN